MNKPNPINKILIVEDNPDHVDLIKLALRKNEAFEIDTCEELNQINDLIQRERYNLIISDIKLPDGDSIEFFRENGLFSQFYVIVMTSFGDEQRAVKALKSGAKDYLVKDTPLFENICNIVERALREIQSIKEKKEMENKLHKSEQKYRTLFESSSDGIFVMKDDVFIECNEKTLEIFEFEKKQDFIGKNPLEISPKLQYNNEKSEVLVKKILSETSMFNKVKRFYWKHIKSDGRSFDAEVSLNPFTLDGQTFFHGIIKDITDIKHTEKLQREVEVAKRSSKMKQQFLANMSHEIRTPLNSILGFTHILKETALDPTQEEYISMIDESSNVLLNLINDILDFSKIEAGKLTLHPKTINICNTLSKIQSFFELPAKQKDLQFMVSCFEEEELFVKVDENRLLQVISNLVSNAIKFTKEGSVDVRLELLKIVQNKAYFRMEVSDTGSGISDYDQRKLFKVFSQLETDDTRNVHGTGLGLAISKQLVGLMGGEIGVYGEVGKGSTFWFTFSAETCESLSAEVMKEKKLDLKNLNLNLKILLAEDKILNQKMASIMLVNAGCKVDIANDGYEVLELFEEDKYDLIFMDIQMPNMDGITAVTQLKEKYKNVPPVIGLSASAMEGDAEKYKKQGLDDYLSKPVQADSIYEKLIEWVQKE